MEIVDELSNQVFNRLVEERKKFTFLPLSLDSAINEHDDQDVYIPDEVESTLLEKHTDSKLQTKLSPDGLHKKLLSLYRETRRIEEEQGINVLYLALGFLRYFDSEKSERAFYGPLILVPVDLERSSVRSQFSLVGRDDDIEPNQSLTSLLMSDFGILLPQLGEEGKESPMSYCRRVEETIATKDRWEVQLNRMVLGFFSFGKFRMLRDLELQESDSEIGSPLLERLLLGSGEAASAGSQISIHAKMENLDKKYSQVKDLGHILDADTSQTQVITAVKDGRNLVVQGPPGTGKSQTIANMIAVMAKAGKRILFIAEKRAALEVVFKRLERSGLGPLCLELHSQKSNRNQFYQELRKTMELHEPVEVAQNKYEEIQRIRDELNHTTALLHEVDEQTGNTPYLLMGRISELLGRGTPPPNFSINGIDTWSKNTFEDHLKAVEAFVAQVQLIGRENTHLWRGVYRRMNTANRIRLSEMLSSLSQFAKEVHKDASTSINNCSLFDSPSLVDCEEIVNLLTALGQQPSELTAVVQSDIVKEHFEALWKLCQNVKTAQEFKISLEPHVVSGAFVQSWEITLNNLKKHGNSIFRIFNGAFKRARQQVLSVSKENNKKIPYLVDLVERLFNYENVIAEIGKRANIGQAFFNLNWQAESTNVQSTLEALDWIRNVIHITKYHEEMQVVVEGNLRDGEYRSRADVLKQQIIDLKHKLTEVKEFAEIDWQNVFADEEMTQVPILTLVSKFENWTQNMDSLDGYHMLRSLGNELDKRDLSNIRACLAKDELPVAKIPDIFRLLRAEKVFYRLAEAEPRIRELDGAERTNNVKKFVELDSELQSLAAQELARNHYLNIPRGQTGQLALIRGEINKKSRHMPIRKLLSEAGDAIVQIKPVFLMSPLSVAQFLEPGRLAFDLLLIDEASQIKPSEALGAVLRCKQMVVVGDQKQMPPTSFFDRQMSADEMDEDEDVSLGGQAVHMESILSLCDARAMERAMLRWHYRSEHPSLIEVSNHEFYDAKLTYPPTPFSGHEGLGLSFVRTNGVYQRGRQRNNPIEADEICEHILAHVRNYPGQSLGVVALSVAQRDTIDNKMEFLRAEHPEVDRFCAESEEEAFFVKNLENVQGDERDVIFISIGYGKDKDGYFGQNFGPVSSQGGERRLNVLFTRARKRCTVFASISYEDIRSDVSAHQGPRVLKAYLKYATTGDMDIPQLTGEEMDSPFERDVANVLLSHGYNIDAQVGSAGFKIDLAVRHPDRSQDYVLAIECDGARYHSSAWARERDRLRQQVLEGKGWKFHRIWSTDWFYNRDTEIKKLLTAIEVVRHTEVVGDTQQRTSGSELDRRMPIERTLSPSDDTPENENGVIAYVEPQISEETANSAACFDIHEVAQDDLAKLVSKIVEIEGSVHQDVIVARIVKLWNVGRTGSRIREALLRAVQHACRSGTIKESKEDGHQFYVSADFTQVKEFRDRTNVKLSQVRKQDYLPLGELRAGVVVIVQEGISVSRDECIKVLGNRLGFSRVTSGLTDRLNHAIDETINRSEIEELRGKLRIRPE
ncbi:MAG: DUF3320 domain-containing protein [Gammaproteobacteria bacterium]|nr:DUF3320 domain-containing protein [Gammaproteobacteria bacterium]